MEHKYLKKFISFLITTIIYYWHMCAFRPWSNMSKLWVRVDTTTLISCFTFFTWLLLFITQTAKTPVSKRYDHIKSDVAWSNVKIMSYLKLVAPENLTDPEHHRVCLDFLKYPVETCESMEPPQSTLTHIFGTLALEESRNSLRVITFRVQSL